MASSRLRTAPPPPSATGRFQPFAPATVSAQPWLAPVSAPAAQPSKGAEKLIGPIGTAKEQATPGPAAMPGAADTPVTTPQTTVTYVPHNAGIGIVIKGPPRQPEHGRSQTGVLLCVGLSFGAATVALVSHAKRRRGFPVGRKNSNGGLRMPSEFKMKDSAIQPEAPLGMLAPAKPTRRSVVELLGSALLLAIHVVRFLAIRLPIRRLAEKLRALWLRVASLEAQASPPPSPEQRPLEVPTPGEPKTSSNDVLPATAPTPERASAGKPMEAKPMEKQPAATAAISSVPADKVQEPPAPRRATASKSAAEHAPAPAERHADAPVSVS